MGLPLCTCEVFPQQVCPIHPDGGWRVTSLAQRIYTQAEMNAAVADQEERIRQLERDVAGARLAEFELIKRERPHDPLYWDMHHERELRDAAGKKGT